MPRLRRPTAPWAALGAALAAVLATLLVAGMATPGSAGTVVDRRAAGVVLTGLDHHGDCPGGFHVEGDHGPADCSHGPDAAPAGVDVRHRPTTAELLAREEAADDEVTAAAGEVPCYGDGTSGPRLQAVYAVAADRTDRYAAVVELVRGYAAGADQAYAASAARDGGTRHLRWVTDPGCSLSVAHVVLSAAGDDSLGATRAELAAQGFDRPDRKYVVWTDATTYCGIAYVAGDARPDATNPANNGPTYARVDSGCWGGTASVAAHEIAHMLGAVNLAAPHSNGAWHCTDEYDRLCYDDGSGASLTFQCASSQEPLLDCNGDDYFNVAPPAGSWLASHWNLASSAFLAPVAPDGWSGPTPTPTPTPTTAPVPAPTAGPVTAPTGPTAAPAPTRVWRVSSWQDRLTPRHRTRRHRVSAEAGALVVRVGLRGAPVVRVTVRGSDGHVLASRLLRRGDRLHRSVPGTVGVTVSGRAGARATVRVGRWTST